MAFQTASQIKGLSNRAAVAAAGALLVAMAILAGCDLSGRQPPSPVAGPRVSPSVGFFLNDDGGTVSLAYGRANSDDVQLMLQCEKGSRRVEIMDVARGAVTAKALPLTLQSGAARSQLQAQVGPDETGVTLATAHAAPDLPALALFRASGAITVKLGQGQPYVLTASADERPRIARFFGACDAKR